MAREAFRRESVAVHGAALCVALLSGFTGGCNCCNFSLDMDFSSCSFIDPCGNGVLDEGEECDEGTANSDSEPDRCRTTCRLARCGDDVVDEGEECEFDPGEVESCSALGLTEGTAVCLSNCRYDLSGCSLCGDGVTEGAEECDIWPPTDLACSDYGFEAGELSCGADCRADITTCIGCGNTVIDDDEPCDGLELGGQTCTSLGYDGGTLLCNPACELDRSGCRLCGNGVCERSLGEGSSVCPQDCGWTEISVGDVTACGARADGSAWCWGSNHTGALGIGTLIGPEICSGEPCSAVPVQVPGLMGVESVAVGLNHACALDATDLHCWGYNYSGQVGQPLGGVPCLGGICQPSPTPVDVERPLAVTVGNEFTCALDVDLEVWCWGSNRYGQLGAGGVTGGATPLSVAGIEQEVNAVVAGAHHACALTSSGTVMCWGRNDLGALGLGYTAGPEDCAGVDCSRTPLEIPGLTDVVGIAAGEGFTCVLTSIDGVFCWGWNLHGQLGDGGIADGLVPVKVLGLGPVTGLAAGSGHVLAVDVNGDVWVWGDWPAGGGAPPLLPELVTGLPEALLVSASATISAAVTIDASGWCWGESEFGTLGDGLSSSSATPLRLE